MVDELPSLDLDEDWLDEPDAPEVLLAVEEPLTEALGPEPELLPPRALKPPPEPEPSDEE